MQNRAEPRGNVHHTSAFADGYGEDGSMSLRPGPVTRSHPSPCPALLAQLSSAQVPECLTGQSAADCPPAPLAMPATLLGHPGT